MGLAITHVLIAALSETRAFEKLEGENLVRVAIENGMSTVEAFRIYGVM